MTNDDVKDLYDNIQTKKPTSKTKAQFVVIARILLADIIGEDMFIYGEYSERIHKQVIKYAEEIFFHSLYFTSK